MAGGGADFGINDEDDPELAMALRISLEEQRMRQQQGAGGGGAAAAEADDGDQAQMDVDQIPGDSGGVVPPILAPAPSAVVEQEMPNFEEMSEEEQMAYAVRLSMPQEGTGQPGLI
jgi:26S proteasome regulatory subunit N10